MTMRCRLWMDWRNVGSQCWFEGMIQPDLEVVTQYTGSANGTMST